MSAFAEAFAEPMAKYAAQVRFQTWGHLEQKRGEIQTGWFVFSVADYGGHHVILGSDWGALPDSPGLYEAMMDYIYQHGVRGKIHRFEGGVRRLLNGKYRFTGKRYVIRQAPLKKVRP